MTAARARSRWAFAAIAGLALLAQLALPLVHRLALVAGDVPPATTHGVAFQPAAASGHNPLDCLLCDALAHGQRRFSTPSASLALAAPFEAPTSLRVASDVAPRLVARLVHAARAPPVGSVSA